MLKILEKIGYKGPIHILNRSPNQYPNYKTSNEIKPINKYEGGIVVIDDMLWAPNSSQKHAFFTRGLHEHLTVFYISQSYFGLPRQRIRKNSGRLKLLKQTLGAVQRLYFDRRGYDMKYDEPKTMFHKVCSEKFNYLCIDMILKNEGQCRFFNESKNTYNECIPETEAF